MVQGLGFSTFTAAAPGFIPNWETKIPQTTQFKKKKKKLFLQSVFASSLKFKLSTSSLEVTSIILE